jgi:hypothetical protein
MDVETTAGSLIRFLQVFNTDSVWCGEGSV